MTNFAKAKSAPLPSGYPRNIGAYRHVLWVFPALMVSNLIVLPLVAFLYLGVAAIYPDAFTNHKPLVWIGFLGYLGSQLYVASRLHRRFMWGVANEDRAKSRQTETLGRGEHAVRIAWFFAWRIAILALIFSFLSAPPLGSVLSIFNDGDAILYRPGVAHVAFAAILGFFSAAFPGLLQRLLRGGKLSLPIQVWLFAVRSIAIFFVLFGIGSIAIAKFGSIDALVNYKLFAIFPLYAVFMLWLGWVAERKRHALAQAPTVRPQAAGQ